jgi:RNA polymerase sigma factor (sigma-70 family)
MDSTRASTTSPEDAAALLRSFVQGERARALRVQLASQHPECSAEEVEDAVQYACKSFLGEAEGISEPAKVYAWIRTAAHRALNRTAQHQTREIAVDPLGNGLGESPSEERGPEEELIAQEDEDEMATLVREVAADLSERRRQVLALYVAGLKRPEIASSLGLSERVVKRYLLDILDEARAAIARKSGGGCIRGEPLVLRFAYGLATSAEAEQARLHMKGCHRCEMLLERLDVWREKAAVLLPASPVVEQASPGLFGRLAHRAVDGVSSVKQQVLGGAAQAKQQAATTYYRTVDPTPLAGARPGTVAAVLVSCVTIGGGAATYCAQNNVDPLGAATGLIASSEGEADPPPSSLSPGEPESTAVVPSPLPAESEQPEVSEPAPSPEPEPEPEPAAEPLPPPPDPGNEPRSPNYPVSEEAESPAPESAPAESREPAPVSGSSPQFGGP